MTTPEITIKPFNSDGALADTIATHHLAVRFRQRADGENQFRTNIYDSQNDLKAIDTYYVQPGGNFFVAEDVAIGAIAGFVGLRKLGETEGSLKRMAVLPGYRRQRIGTRLVDTAVTWAIDAGFKKLVLTTGNHENAIHIYKAIGFEKVGEDVAHDDILMAMELRV